MGGRGGGGGGGVYTFLQDRSFSCPNVQGTIIYFSNFQTDSRGEGKAFLIIVFSDIVLTL